MNAIPVRHQPLLPPAFVAPLPAPASEVHALLASLAEFMGDHPLFGSAEAFAICKNAPGVSWSAGYDAHAALTSAGYDWLGSCDAAQTELVAQLVEQHGQTMPPEAPATVPPPPVSTVVEVLPSPTAHVAMLVSNAMAELRRASLIATEECSRPVAFMLERLVGFCEPIARELTAAARRVGRAAL